VFIHQRGCAIAQAVLIYQRGCAIAQVVLVHQRGCAIVQAVFRQDVFSYIKVIGVISKVEFFIIYMAVP
jgi:hypothetical protein